MKKLLCLFIFMGIFSAEMVPVVEAQVGNKYYYGRRQGPHNHRWVWTKRKRYYSVGLTLGAINYFGDITPQQNFLSTDIEFTRVGIGLDIQKRIRPQWSWELSINYGRLMAADSLSAVPSDEDGQFRYIRNLHFRNDVISAAFMLEFDLISRERMNQEYYDRPNQFIPYLVFGVGVVFHDPQAKTPDVAYDGSEPLWEPGQWVSLQPLGTEGQGRINPETGQMYRDKYSRVQIAFPLGFGVRKKLGPRWDISFEFNYYFFLTDYLDDVSENYLDPGIFLADDPTEQDYLAQALHDRSEPYNTARLDGVTDYMPPLTTFRGADGQLYTSYVGFGNDLFPDNIRGNIRDNDVFMVTGFTLSYIIPREGVRCPIRFR